MTNRAAPRRRHLAAALTLLCALGACTTTGERQESAAPDLGATNLLALASATLAGGDINAALGLYRRAIAANPAAVEPRVALAEAYFVSGALTDARVAYTALIDDAPFEAEIGLGRVALAGGDATPAAGHFQSALALEPSSVRALNGLAVARDLDGDHQGAQVLYAEALLQDPTNRSVANNLALSQILSGRFDPAIGRLEELTAGGLELPQARHNLALAYGLLGDEQAARRLIETDLDSGAVDRNLEFYRAARPLADVAPAAAP